MSNTFASFNWDEEQQLDAADIKEAAERLEYLINKAVDARENVHGAVSGASQAKIGRYRALAMTHLETAVMFANKGLSRRTL